MAANDNLMLADIVRATEDGLFAIMNSDLFSFDRAIEQLDKYEREINNSPLTVVRVSDMEYVFVTLEKLSDCSNSLAYGMNDGVDNMRKELGQTMQNVIATARAKLKAYNTKLFTYVDGKVPGAARDEIFNATTSMNTSTTDPALTGSTQTTTTAGAGEQQGGPPQQIDQQRQMAPVLLFLHGAARTLNWLFVGMTPPFVATAIHAVRNFFYN